MHRQLLAGMVIVDALLASCQPLPSDASRTYPPGRASDVAHAVTATGSVAGDGFRAPRVLPGSDLPAGSVPVVEPAEIIHIWFFPAVSHDGSAFREGFWCHRVIRTFAWGPARAMEEGSIPLPGVDDPEGGRSGDRGADARAGEELGSDASGRIEPQDAFLDSVRDLGHESVPYAPVRTLEPSQRPAGSVPSPTTSTSPVGR